GLAEVVQLAFDLLNLPFNIGQLRLHGQHVLHFRGSGHDLLQLRFGALQIGELAVQIDVFLRYIIAGDHLRINRQGTALELLKDDDELVCGDAHADSALRNLDAVEGAVRRGIRADDPAANAFGPLGDLDDSLRGILDGQRERGVLEDDSLLLGVAYRFAP